MVDKETREEIFPLIRGDYIKCWKCKKKMKKSEHKDIRYGYNQFFCKKCYKEFSKQALKEVEKITKYL